MNDEIDVCRISEDFLSNNFQKKLSYHIIETILYFMTGYPVVACINYGINNNKSDVYLGLLLIIPIIIMVFFMMKIKSLKIFFLSMLSFVLVLAFIIGFMLRRYAFAVMLIIFAYRIFKNSLKKQNVKFSIFTFIVMEIVLIPQNIVAMIAGIGEVVNLIKVISILIMIISLSYLIKIRNTRLSMEDNDNLSGSRSNNSFVFCFGTLIAALMVCVSLSGVFKVTANSDKKIVDTIMDVLNVNYVKEAMEYQQDDDSDDGKGEKSLFENIFGENMLQTGSKVPESVRIISEILEKLIITVLLLGFIYFALNRIMILCKSAKNMEKVTFVYNEEKEDKKTNKEKVKSTYENIIKNVFLTNKDKARKIYKNRILKFRKDKVIISNEDTVGDIQNKILNETSHDIKEISSVYNKIRYSDKEVTKQDLDKIKNSKC